MQYNCILRQLKFKIDKFQTKNGDILFFAGNIDFWYKLEMPINVLEQNDKVMVTPVMFNL